MEWVFYASHGGDVEVRPDITSLLYLVLDNKPKGRFWFVYWICMNMYIDQYCNELHYIIYIYINNTNLSHITYMCIRHTVTHFQRFPAISRRREELPNGVVASEVDLACGKEVHGHAPCCSREQHHRLSKKHPGTGEHHCTIAPLATTWDHWVILSAGHHLGHSRAPLGILTSLKMSEVWNAMSESAVRHV